MTDKTMIFWVRKGARKPMMQGLASAECSVLRIHDFTRMAARGDGRLYIVDGPNAAHGRRRIAAYRANQAQDIGGPGMTASLHDGRVVAIGVNACRAIAGATEGARNWDARLARDGRVRIADTRALGARSDGIEPSLSDWFGSK